MGVGNTRSLLFAALCPRKEFDWVGQRLVLGVVAKHETCSSQLHLPLGLPERIDANMRQLTVGSAGGF